MKISFFEKIKSQISIHFIFIVFTAPFIWGVWLTQYIRPAADDYCIAKVVSENGIFGGLRYWWNSWGGYLPTFLMENIFIGAPISLFPLEISALPSVLFTILTMIAVIITMIGKDASNKVKIHIALLLPIFWWVYLWLGIPELSLNLEFVNGITHWQTLNIGYIASINICIALFWWLNFNSKIESVYLKTLLITIIGLFIGMSAPPVNISIFLATFVFIFINAYKKLKFFPYLLLNCNILIGSLVAQYSPGQQLRISLLQSKPNFDPIQLASFAISSIIDGVYLFADSILNYRILAILIIFFFLFYKLFKTDPTNNYKIYIRNGFYLTILALIIFIVTNFSEKFAYSAYWHYVDGKLLTYYVAFFIGSGSGIFFSKATAESKLAKILNLAILSLILILIAISLHHMSQSIFKRSNSWHIGPAPVIGVMDIEKEDGDFAACWNIVNNRRANPIARTNTRVNERIKFTRGSDSLRYLSGTNINAWHTPEEWGVWLSQKTGEIRIPRPVSKYESIELEIIGYFSKRHITQKIVIKTNDGLVYNYVLKPNAVNKVLLPIKDFGVESNVLVIEISPENPASPRELGETNDERVLSIGLISAQFN